MVSLFSAGYPTHSVDQADLEFKVIVDQAASVSWMQR